LSQFEGRAKFSTWLTKIAVYEAYARLRRFDYQNVDSISELEEKGLYMNSNERDPERQTFDGEMKLLLERAFDALPGDYRSVFMLREIEGLSTAETADCLEISEENVKTRLHRARELLQRELYSAAGATARTAFQFLGARCDRIVSRVMARIQERDGGRV
jgi:RNA polymerase sigma-70 factor (ECF subfamily)